jgi:hypothetical protein
MPDTTSVLDEFIAACESRLTTTAALSPRARVLTSLIRFADRAKSMVEAVEAREPGVRLLAAILDFRDMARREQSWIDEIPFQSPTPGPERRTRSPAGMRDIAD